MADYKTFYDDIVQNSNFLEYAKIYANTCVNMPDDSFYPSSSGYKPYYKIIKSVSSIKEDGSSSISLNFICFISKDGDFIYSDSGNVNLATHLVFKKTIDEKGFPKYDLDTTNSYVNKTLTKTGGGFNSFNYLDRLSNFDSYSVLYTCFTNSPSLTLGSRHFYSGVCTDILATTSTSSGGSSGNVNVDFPISKTEFMLIPLMLGVLIFLLFFRWLYPNKGGKDLR